MAETLIALLLVTTSANGSNLVFRWPEFPTASPRLSRARPDDTLSLSQLDNPWRASHSQEAAESVEQAPRQYGSDPDYCWQRPNALRDKDLKYGHSSPDRRPSHSRHRSFNGYDTKTPVPDEYEHVLGYKAEFLAQHLCPQRSMCHQKFELVVDDLAFIGHPVRADSDGGWRFKPEKIKTGSRGREASELGGSTSPHNDNSTSSISESSNTEPPSSSQSKWLHTFHFALVLDLPDPSSSASGNLSKYFNILYEQIAFTFTAVLYQEQVLSNFVEQECDTLIALKDSCISKGEPFSTYTTKAFEVSSIAPAMKTIFEAIKTSSVAYITINYLPLELQLPPYLDALLHSQDDQETDLIDRHEDDVSLNWGQDMGLGWKLPIMAPWKTILLLDVDNNVVPDQVLQGPYDTPEDKKLAEGLVRFLETASITLSLFDMANLLDWDLDTQVYPIVKWLILHRRAKVVDVVHAGLKTVFALPPKFNVPLPELTVQFQEAFSHPSVPPLPRILATISTSMSRQTDNHFFASVVKSKELIPMYHDVVQWMLKRDMLITLHLRIRVVATRELKLRVKSERDLKLSRQYGKGHLSRSRLKSSRSTDHEDGQPSTRARGSRIFPGNSPTAPLTFSRRVSSNESGRSDISELNFPEDSVLAEEESDSNSEVDEEDSGWDTTEDHMWPGIINDPGKATPMQRRWLSAMSDGKESDIARRFELINQYFDGKRSDDEILYRAEITRKQLREVLHHYEDYLQTFLHPS
ncbi:hypothetical protein NLJ89_g1047 [Agrocybe chaxingu]|uniref:Nitrogen permease regulator 3 n=1 Tax=Agrocybe chaxingu TaxID=84603 RepID=A0A9W8N0V0_9AGAR|nr:hypothetical protein NLJ89_g1047 [Agrocybe chaxingu]